ncbi:hypothetical protein K435DRAFT_824039 [Dendrothele bispora CBS 962.96]|uniref:Uncharacterized protein n=1 Tax=Dendrothele bispora (strain CBS 962.96) TaxID=1314807 RepID=A0A4S8KST1_DENBC|nr:hypothetical protein K435DRAFT_824039 [Dendrothele bispora CBS 962.96]
MESNVSGGNYEPFWAGFSYSNIYLAMTPDVLHQLYQGIVVHLIEWVQRVISEEKLDERIQALPPSFGVRHFKNGISSLSQVSGGEHKNIAKILVGCLHGSGIADKGIAACRALMDFIYIAQYQSHDTTTLLYLESALEEWHKNKTFFINKASAVNILKFHSLLHYSKSISMLGTTDNFNTETFKRLHIDFAKEGWHASNKRDHFPQMVTWLCRREKIAPSNTFHHAPNFEKHLKKYVNGFPLDTTPLPFDRVDVWHQFKLNPTSLVDGEVWVETVKALPVWKHSTNTRFDTVIALVNDNAESTAVEGRWSGWSCTGHIPVAIRTPKAWIQDKLCGTLEAGAIGLCRMVF